MTAKLSYSDHIESIVSKSSQKLGLIKRHCNMVCQTQAKRTLYIAIVRSLFEHCSPIWRPTSENGLNKFEKIQKRAVKFILNEQYASYSDTEYKEKLYELKLLPMSLKFLYTDLSLLHKIVYSHIPLQLPPYLHMYNRLSDFTRTTRFQSERDDLHIVCTERARLESFEQSFFYRTHLAWNLLPLSLREVRNPSLFSTKLKNHMLDFGVT